MPQDFVVRSNATLDKICSSATSVEDMKAQMHAALERSGSIVHDRDGNVVGQAAQPVFERNVGRCMRVVYPSGNDRFELYADSEEDLDRKESALRAMYGK
jgi:hypothetical protein